MAGDQLAAAYIPVRYDASKMPSDLAAMRAAMQAGMSSMAAGVQSAMGAVSSLPGQMASGFGSLMGQVAALGGAVAMIHSFTESAVHAESATLRWEHRVGQHSATVGYTTEQMHAINEEVASFSTFSAGAARDASALLLQFSNIRGDQFRDTMKSAAGLAELTGTDLPDAASKLGMALQYPERAMRILRQAGINLTQGQAETIKSLMAGGDIVGAQRQILDAVQAEVGNFSEKFRNTEEGRQRMLANEWGKVKKIIGGAFVDAFQAMEPAMKQIAEWIQSHKDDIKAAGAAISDAFLKAGRAVQIVIAFFQQLSPEVKSWLMFSAEWIGKSYLLYTSYRILGNVLSGLPLGTVAQGLKMMALYAWANPYVLLAAALVAVGVAIAGFAGAFEGTEFGDMFNDWADQLQDFWDTLVSNEAVDQWIGEMEDAFDTIAGDIQDLIGWFKDAWDEGIGYVMDLWDDMEEFVVGVMAAISAPVGMVIAGIGAAFEWLQGLVGNVFGGIFGWVRDTFGGIWGNALFVFSNIGGIVNNLGLTIKVVWLTIKTAFLEVVQGLISGWAQFVGVFHGVAAVIETVWNRAIAGITSGFDSAIYAAQVAATYLPGGGGQERRTALASERDEANRRRNMTAEERADYDRARREGGTTFLLEGALAAATARGEPAERIAAIQQELDATRAANARAAAIEAAANARQGMPLEDVFRDARQRGIAGMGGGGDLAGDARRARDEAIDELGRRLAGGGGPDILGALGGMMPGMPGMNAIFNALMPAINAPARQGGPDVGAAAPDTEYDLGKQKGTAFSGLSEMWKKIQDSAGAKTQELQKRTVVAAERTVVINEMMLEQLRREQRVIIPARAG